MLRRNKNYTITPWWQRNSSRPCSIKESPLSHRWDQHPGSQRRAASHQSLRTLKKPGYFSDLKKTLISPLGEDEEEMGEDNHIMVLSAGFSFNLCHDREQRSVLSPDTPWSLTNLSTVSCSPAPAPSLSSFSFASSVSFSWLLHFIPPHSCWQIIYLLHFPRHFKDVSVFKSVICKSKLSILYQKSKLVRILKLLNKQTAQCNLAGFRGNLTLLSYHIHIQDIPLKYEECVDLQKTKKK